MSDWLIFSFVFLGVGFGYLIGEVSGVRRGYKFCMDELSGEHPILNVRVFAMEEGTFKFVDMLTEELIHVGTPDECIEKIRKTSNKTVVFSNGDDTE